MLNSNLIKLKTQHKNSHTQIIKDYKQNTKPQFVLRSLSNLFDNTLIELIKNYPIPSQACLIAIGGYGRGEMYPHSDLDLLILLKRQPNNDDVGLIESLITAMWDIGLNPSHSVRTIKQCQELCSVDVITQTSLLESRYITGNKNLFETLTISNYSLLDAKKFFISKKAEMRQRHAHFSNTAYALEPNCKESPGALRDLQLLLWLANAAGLGKTWPQVMRNGAISNSEYRSIQSAFTAFKRLRIDLHLLTNRNEDRLLFDLQPDLAKIYNLSANKHKSASEILMQRYYWAARIVSQLTTILLPAIEEMLFPSVAKPIIIDNDFSILEGKLKVNDNNAFVNNPSLIFKAFLHAQSHPEISSMTADTLRSIWHSKHLINVSFRTNPKNRKLFIQILKQQLKVAKTLYDMSVLNILPGYLPEFRRIVGQAQHDLFHAYTVDEHTLKVIANLRRFCIADIAYEYPLASQLINDFDAPWLIYIAALFHDIAKGTGEDHSIAGTKLVKKFCINHSIDGQDTKLVCFLVLHHLTMSMVAQKKDLNDPDIIKEFAATVKNKRNLDALYLLTVADIRATNPNLWNSWKGKLLEDLYQNTLIFLSGDKPNKKSVYQQRKKNAAQICIGLGINEEQQNIVWRQLDLAYFMRHEANEIAWHTEQIYNHIHDNHTVVVRARVLGNDEALQVMVWSIDKKNLFASICQYFERETLNIQDARIHTTKHGYALDSFVVISEHKDETKYMDKIGTVQRELVHHLQSNIDLVEKIKNIRTDKIIKLTKNIPIKTKINLSKDDYSGGWKLEIYCVEQPSLLFKIAKVFVEFKINLKMAKIHTMGHRVEDVFIIESQNLNNYSTRLQFEQVLYNAINLENNIFH